MNIILDGRVDFQTGMYTYLMNLNDNLSLVDSHLNINILKNKFNILKTNNKKIRALDDIFYEFSIMSHDLKSIGCDIFHCTKNFGIPYFVSFPVVVTIHDLIPLMLRNDYSPSVLHYNYFKYNFKRSIMQSDAIISISKFTQNEIYKKFSKLQHKLYCIPQGCNQLFGNSVDIDKSLKIMKSFGIERDFILVMGGAEPRKNVAMLVSLFDENSDVIPSDLVLIGGNWSSYTIPTPKMRKRDFHCLKNLSENELAAVYKMATVFVFPSIYEGFGLPVLEAMACGTPVLAHNGSSIPEVAGDAAMLVNMHNPDECLRALSRLLTNRSLREEYIAAGRERVKMFSWEKTAAQTLEVYKSVL